MGGGRGAPGEPHLTEAAYVRLWEQYCQVKGKPFSVETVRGWYRDYQRRLGQG